MSEDDLSRTSEEDVPTTSETDRVDWFSAGEDEVEWPAFASPRRERKGAPKPKRKPTKASDDVRHLFPVPDATDWDVGELRYDRKTKKA